MKIMSRNIAINISLAIATGFMTMNASAFEYLGVKSGMTRTEIAQLPGWGNKKKTATANYNKGKNNLESALFDLNQCVQLDSLNNGFHFCIHEFLFLFP